MKTLTMYSVIFCSALLLFSCANTGKNGGNTPPDDGGNTETPATGWELLIDGRQCAIETAGQKIAASEEEMRALWEETFSGIDMAPAMPSIDFDKYHVVAAYMGMVRSGGHGVSFQSVEGNSVVIQHTKPGPGCMAAAVIEFPFAIAKVLPFTSDPVDIKIVEVVEDCE